MPQRALPYRCVQKLESPHQEHIGRLFPGEGREVATSVGNLQLPFPFFFLLLLLLFFFIFIFFLLLVAWLQQATSDNTKTKDFDTTSCHICWARPPGIVKYIRTVLSNVVFFNRRLPLEIIWQLTSGCWSNSEKEDDFLVRTLWTGSLWEDRRQVRVHLTS